MTYNEAFERVQKMLDDLKRMLDNPNLTDEIMDKIECKAEDLGELIGNLEKELEKDIRLNS